PSHALSTFPTRRSSDLETLLEEFDVTLKPGKNVFTVDEPEVSSAGAFTYDATFTPATAADDRLIENNTASGFTFVRGRGRVLLIDRKSTRLNSSHVKIS